MPVFFDLDVVARLAEREGVALAEAEAMLAAAIPSIDEEGDE
jgi:hypothetical protein